MQTVKNASEALNISLVKALLQSALLESLVNLLMLFAQSIPDGHGFSVRVFEVIVLNVAYQER